MADSDKFDWNEAKGNWSRLLSESGQSFWNTVTDRETWESLGKSGSDATRNILAELGELAELGAEEAQEKLRPLLQAAVDKGEMTAEQAAQLTKELFNGDISWEDTKSYWADKKDDFAAWSRKVGSGAAELGGNLLRSVPGLLGAGATAFTIFAMANGMMGVESLWSIKGIFTAVCAFGIAVVAAPAIGGKVQNWWFDKYPNQSPQKGNEPDPARNASAEPDKVKGNDVASVDIPKEVTRNKMAFKETNDVKMASFDYTQEPDNLLHRR